MTTPARADREPEKDLKLGFGESVDLDVRFCDLVAGRDHEPPYQLRFRGYVAGTHEGVRLYCALDDVEGPMLHEQILRAHVVRPDAIDRTTRLEIPLERHAITITRFRVAGGRVKYAVRARDDRDVKQIVRAVQEVADQVVPVLQEMGFAVSGTDVLDAARELVRRRTPLG